MKYFNSNFFSTNNAFIPAINVPCSALLLAMPACMQGKKDAHKPFVYLEKFNISLLDDEIHFVIARAFINH